MQLPRDQSSASGRARAKALFIEEAIGHTFEYVPIARADRGRQHAANRACPWAHVQNGDDLSGGENDADDSYSDSSRREGSGRLGRARGYSITQQFHEAGMRWPSAPKRGRFEGFATAGRSRGDTGVEGGPRTLSLGNDHSRTSSSYSPPRSRIGAFGTSSAAGSAHTPEDMRRRRASSLDGWISGLAGGAEPTWTTGSDSLTRRNRWLRSISPLMAPLDRYRASRTVVRAGTLVSRADVATVERSSRQALLAVRRASEAHITTGKRSNQAASSPPSRGPHRCRQTRDGGGRADWVEVGKAVDSEERAGREKLRRLLPSMESIDKELHAIRKADSAMRQEQLAQVWQARGAGRCRKRFRTVLSC